MTKQEAIARAKQFALAQGWAWVEPVRAEFRRQWFGKGGKWEVYSHASGLGAMARVVLDAETGEVMDKGYIPR